MPQNITGLPPANEVYGQNVKMLRPGKERSSYALDKKIEDARVAREQQKARIQQDAAYINPANPAPGLLAGAPADEVISTALGRPVSPTVAKRALQYIDVLGPDGLNAEQAVFLAERELSGQAIPSRAVDAIRDMGEVGPALQEVNASQPGRAREPLQTIGATKKGGGERFKDEYLIPMLVAKQTEEYRPGEFQTPTIAEAGRRRYDPRSVEIALLNPRAPLSEGEQDYSSRRGSFENPDADRRDRQPETVAQALKNVLLEGRTPIVSRSPDQVVSTGKRDEFVDKTNPNVVLYRYAQDPGGATDSYRVGSRGRLTPEALAAANRILEQAVGGVPVVNQKLRDEAMFELQQRMLEASSIPSVLTTPATSERYGREIVNNPALNLLNTITEAADAPVSEISRSALVNDASDMEFYRNLVGGDLKQMAEKITVQQQSSARPQNSAINATNNSPVNAPAPQLDVESQRDVLNQLNDQARQNIERGLGGSQTSRNAAMQFLSQFKARLLGR